MGFYMLCTKCKKRIAVVFITTMQGDSKNNEGLCLMCAKDLGVPQVNDYIKQIGISEEDIEDYCDMMFSGDELQENGNELDDDFDDGDSFHPGGAGTIPKFLQNLMSGFNANDKNGIYDKNNAIDKNKEISDKEKQEREKRKQRERDKKRKFLDSYCINLTEKAKEGSLDRIIGRDKEIYRVTQILSRRQKNNPCLIGEPGVGKTAIAEGIAQKIVEGNVPFRLQNKQVYLLDLTALVAGTQFRGQFESRVKTLIDEVKSAGNIILFIDEVHNLVGAGDSSEGSMSAANIFKPALSRGEMQVIGATTFSEYRKHIEKDSALERRFQPVTVNEPSFEDTIEVLKGIKSYYESHHKVKITNDILRLCAVLSERYITDRYLPDKAIDLLDESCSCASIKNPYLNEYEKLTIDIDKNTKEKTELEDEIGERDYQKIAELKTEIARAEDRLNELKPEVDNIYVTEEDLSKVIELWTGIPANKIMETEFKKISRLEDVLKSKIIGQDTACELVAKAMKRSRVQLAARRRPASFIFVGPTGVGKTELVKVLANELFDTVDPLIRLDMSEFMEKHAVSRLIGSPPGYIGYDEAGQLTEKVRRRPYSVILFDEIEKAHPDVMNILLQILDEGKVNDAHGRTVNFENTVICMTSNAGSIDKSTGVGFGKTNADISKDKAMKALNEFLRPEFLSRIDEIVVFSPLSVENYQQIAGLMVSEMKAPLEEKGIKLDCSQEACLYLAKKSHGGKYGARDLRRVIRKEVEDEVASIIIDNAGEHINTIHINLCEDKLEIGIKN